MANTIFRGYSFYSHCVRCAKKLKYRKSFPTAVPMFSEANRLKHILWAKKNMRTRWQHAIFADEASFWLSRGRVKI